MTAPQPDTAPAIKALDDAKAALWVAEATGYPLEDFQAAVDLARSDLNTVIGARFRSVTTQRPAPRLSPSVAANDNHPAPPAVRPLPQPPTPTRTRPSWPGIISSGQLVSMFTPPDYAIDGIVQAGFLYGVTASTGTGKTAILLLTTALTALGLPMGTRDVRQGRVVYFAGENPDDVTMRWIGMAHSMGFDVDDIDVHFIPGTFDITGLIIEVNAAVEKLGGVDLVVVDTSAAYFQGADENANVDMARHARNLRVLTTLPGHPCVLVACHPTKSADQSNLLPRGGGAFLAELDGNLVCMRTDAGAVKLHWQGKHRGPDFKPVLFDLTTVTAPSLKDSRGRDIPTVVASVVSEGEVQTRRVTARRDEDEVLIAIDNLKAPSLAAIAEYLKWQDADGSPHKRRAQTATTRLRRDKLVDLMRDGWVLTKAGQDAAGKARGDLQRERQAEAAVGALVASAERKKRPISDRTDTERTDGYGSGETSPFSVEPYAFEPTEPNGEKQPMSQ
jgi:hypothetical protein